MNFIQNYISCSQHSTKPSSAKSNLKNSKYAISDKENINFLNFSKIAINSTSKSQDKRCNTIDFLPNSFNISKFTTENVGPYKFQTEANTSNHIISSKNYTNASHFRYKSIANMPYKMPVHEPSFKRTSQKLDKGFGVEDSQVIKPKNKILGDFQKSFQSQNFSISIQKKPGDLIEIPEISSPEKDEKIPDIDENYRVYSLMKSFKHIEIVSKQQLVKKESFMSSFSNNENKSMISFPDEITNSAHKNLLFFKKMHSTPKLLSNLIKKHNNIFNNNNNNTLFHNKISEIKADKILKCVEKLEEPEPFTNNFFSKERNPASTKPTQNAENNKEENETSNINSSIYKFLLIRETSYQLNPHFLKFQEEINGTMRAVLIDWMSEVSTEFCLKRHTLQQAIYYLDKYLEVNKSMKKQTLQLVGVSSLLISSKLEEIQSPTLVQYRKACDDGYSLKEIQTMELNIMKDLKWLLNPPTLQNWTDIYLAQWDYFIDNCDENEELAFVDGVKKFFRKPEEQSYIHYRDFTQILDAAALDYRTLQYKPRVLIASLLFLLLGSYYKVFTKNEIIEEFTETSKFLFNFPQYNLFFSEFLENYFGFTLYEMLPTIQYLSQFFEMEFLYELPPAEHLFEGNNLFEGYYEEFLSYHVHHPKALEFIRNKLLN